MLREQSRRLTKKSVKFLLVESGLWSWAESANSPMTNPDAPSSNEINDGAIDEVEDWQADFEQALKDLEEEEFVEIPAPPAPVEVPKTTVEEAPPAGGYQLNEENVQLVLDESVRPALQADGGDISLVKIEENNIYVELIGACASCPSSTMTMKMGIEQMLHDEFPDLNELINMNDPVQPFF